MKDLKLKLNELQNRPAEWRAALTLNEKIASKKLNTNLTTLIFGKPRSGRFKIKEIGELNNLLKRFEEIKADWHVWKSN